MLLLWLTLSQVLFYFIQDSRATAFEKSTRNWARQEDEYFDPIRLAKQFTEFSANKEINCLLLSKVMSENLPILDLRFNPSSCHKSDWFLSGKWIASQVTSVNGDRYTAEYRVLNDFQFYFSLWLFRALGLFIALFVILLLKTSVDKSKREAEIENRATQKFNELAQQAAHDIRSPLMALTNLKSHISFSSADTEDFFKQVLVRIEGIAQDLLKTKKSIEKALPTNKEESDKVILSWDLKPILNSLVKEKNIEYKDKNKIILKDNVESLSISPKITQQDIERILSNLINNAVEASPAQADIYIETLTRQQQTQIHITDFGIGFIPEDLEKIGKEAFTNKANGNGLGLKSSHQLIKNWGGSFKIQSQQGMGTRVSISLPC